MTSDKCHLPLLFLDIISPIVIYPKQSRQLDKKEAQIVMDICFYRYKHIQYDFAERMDGEKYREIQAFMWVYCERHLCRHTQINNSYTKL